MRRSGTAGGPPAPRDWHSRGYLPHFDRAGVYQLITYRLADALPDDVRRIARNAQERAVIERYLDAGYGSCLLRRREIARIVIESWKYFDGERYRLIAWVVMPTHVHLLIKVAPGQSLSRIVHSWKSYSAKVIAKVANVAGPIWHPDYWDRFIRDATHFAAAVDYIVQNPVKAGLAERPDEWSWSSASTAGGPPAVPGV